MERSEPTLVPEWLRSTGSVTGGGSSAHHFASSSSHSDVSSLANHLRNRTSKSITDFDSPRSAFLDRSSSSNSRRTSSNGSAKHAYSSFNRSHRDKDREKEKERSNFGDHWDRDSSDPLGNIFTSRVEKDTLRRSQSMVSRKQTELLPRRAAIDSKSSGNSNHHNGNGLLSGVGVGIQKVVFDKDFPSLGTEERPAAPDIGRVPSPGFSTAVQSLPVGSSALIGGEGWTSALAEVPSTIIGSSSSGSFPVQPTVAATSSSGASTAMSGLNMAEALSQAPAKARTVPQLSIKTQRLEELAIKQSRQLIPVTPSMPKPSVLSSSDKSKPKAAARPGETNAPVKVGQQQPSQLQNQSLRGGSVKSDAPKTSKFLVLKPVWENGVSSSSKDVTSPTSNASRAANSPLAVAPPVASVPLRSPNHQKLSSVDRKVAALDLKSGSTLEKRPSLSQVQSRNDFFKRLKNKTLMNSTITLPDSAPIISSPTMEKSGDITRELFIDPASPHTIENGALVTGNGDSSEDVQKFSDTGPSAAVYPDEEEARFLRSLGWEENSGDDGGLTEEEINAFYDQYMKSRPSMKCRGMQPKLAVVSESPVTDLGKARSELRSTDSVSEA
ncbi:mediator of RNA polymerase II transcription subunit 1 [Pyrus ussuriensis x Pyrus communis]|uniref:Mediator of RNA polymerase II transcription subunit 1 n=1 Tax=Pyrus ussuriensis x Pyrus communis TaxID=2448454 RepID=A0A5N5GR66_9ROSA|nr:mediator of RNA polymerase II transcription subunit 1 [Pyrus ussuriensis x Pyrus communis]